MVCDGKTNHSKYFSCWDICKGKRMGDSRAYINYQGEKLMNRFNAYSYWLLTKSMYSHNIARGRNKITEEVLQSISQNALIIGINSDILCPVEEQRFLFKYLRHATLVEIDSAYGHDGFLVETEKISEHLGRWIEDLQNEE